jgi:CDP-glucose 4,6-dehydratase
MKSVDFEQAYRRRNVLVTGHTGFKGSWLVHWLHKLGANITGLALEPEQEETSLFKRSGVAELMASHIGDVRDLSEVDAAFWGSAPDIVFHLAAQPLVRRSYRQPLETFATNVMGTAHVLDAARRCPTVKAVVCITTDKVYEERTQVWGYREIDTLGGKDPYSASKAAAELVANSYRTLYAADQRIALATARGGNVIGGGDWSEDRIVVDIVKAVEAGSQVVLRNPLAVRPWQHVLELCRGYLMLGARLLEHDPAAAEAWNFGPGRGNEITVLDLTRRLLAALEADTTQVSVEGAALPEAKVLRLDIAKAQEILRWSPQLGIDETVAWTAEWYRSCRSRPGAERAVLEAQIARYRDLTCRPSQT